MWIHCGEQWWILLCRLSESLWFKVSYTKNSSMPMKIKQKSTGIEKSNFKHQLVVAEMVVISSTPGTYNHLFSSPHLTCNLTVSDTLSTGLPWTKRSRSISSSTPAVSSKCPCLLLSHHTTLPFHRAYSTCLCLCILNMALHGTWLYSQSHFISPLHWGMAALCQLPRPTQTSACTFYIVQCQCLSL